MRGSGNVYIPALFSDMKYLQSDHSLRLLCVNGDSFLHHPSKIRSFHLKVILNEPFSTLFTYASTPRQYSDMVRYACETLTVAETEAEEIIQYFLSSGFLQEVSVDNSDQSKWQDNNWSEALQFHLHTNKLPKMMYNTNDGEHEDVRLMHHYANESTPPDNYKHMLGESIPLDKPDVDVNITLDKLFQAPQSALLDKTLLSRLLYYGFGQMGVRNMHVTGAHIRKTVPSGGSRHPIEVFLIIKSIKGLTPGIYHYQVKDHSLTFCTPLDERMAEQVIRDNVLLDENRPGFPFSTALLYSCVFARSMFRYRESRSYRVMHFDMGHLTQNLCFLAKVYGLNLYSGYSCKEKILEKMIDVDSYMEPIIAYSVL